MYTLMPDDLGYLKHQKQIHELKVGRAMYEWYGSETRLLNTVRQVVAYAFLRYFELLGLDPWLGATPPTAPRNFRSYVDLLDILPDAGGTRKGATETVIKKLINKEKFLLVWDRHSSGTAGQLEVRGLGNVLTQYARWSVSDCSELVRVWGGIVEEIGLASATLTSELGSTDALAIALRLDDVRKRAKGQSAEFDRRQKNHWLSRDSSDIGQIMTSYRLQNVQAAHRSLKSGGVRDRIAYAADARQVPRWLQDYVFPGDDPAIVGTPSSKWVRGCSLLKPAPASLQKHLDAVFGLWEGADISGTTTDFVGCFEAAWMMVFEGVLAARNDESDVNAALEVMTWCFPYFALLAPAAMVYGFHHTTYEIAVALSLAYGTDHGDGAPAVFSYYVGWYESLVPNITHVMSGSSGGGAAVMAAGRTEEARLKRTLTEAIAAVGNARDAFNPIVVALVDSKGVVYGGYLLEGSEPATHKTWFEAKYIHEQALTIGAHGISEQLLARIDGNYKTKLAGAYWERYA